MQYALAIITGLMAFGVIGEYTGAWIWAVFALSLAVCVASSED